MPADRTAPHPNRGATATGRPRDRARLRAGGGILFRRTIGWPARLMILLLLLLGIVFADWAADRHWLQGRLNDTILAVAVNPDDRTLATRPLEHSRRLLTTDAAVVPANSSR